MDRVKAAIFSSLGDKVIGARVLDLFAGAGGLGIEALSRGATEATFVENDREAVETIERNLLLAGVKGRVRRRDVFDFLRGENSVFDVILADPPYEHAEGDPPFTARLLQSAELAALLAADGILVLEKRPGESLPEMPGWEMIRQRAYGATEVLMLRRVIAAP